MPFTAPHGGSGAWHNNNKNNKNKNIKNKNKNKNNKNNKNKMLVPNIDISKVQGNSGSGEKKINIDYGLYKNYLCFLFRCKSIC